MKGRLKLFPMMLALVLVTGCKGSSDDSAQAAPVSTPQQVAVAVVQPDPPPPAPPAVLPSRPAPIVTVGLVEMLMGVKITDALARISMPTLILHPDSSPFLPVEVPRGAHKIIAQSELHIFEAAKHGIAFSHARESALLVRNFIERAAIDRNADAT